MIRSTRTPSLIVEVLSPSTEQSDRGEKWQQYRRIASLSAYVLIDAESPYIEVYTRKGDGWLLREVGPGQVIELGVLDATLDTDALYAGREG